MKNGVIYLLLIVLMVTSIVSIVYARQPMGFALMAAAILALAYFFIRGNKKR